MIAFVSCVETFSYKLSADEIARYKVFALNSACIADR